MHLAKDGIVLAENGDIFVPAVWLNDQSLVAFSENGYSNRTWTIPAGCAITSDTPAYTIEYNNKTPFTDFKLDGRQLTLSLAPGQMVIFSKAIPE